MTNELQDIINRSFLNRVPEIMERGGFTLETAMEQAFKEDNALCLELYNQDSERSQMVCRELSNRTYEAIRAANPNPPKSWNPRYVDYATAHGHSPEEQQRIDGNAINYMAWVSRQRA